MSAHGGFSINNNSSGGTINTTPSEVGLTNAFVSSLNLDLTTAGVIEFEIAGRYEVHWHLDVESATDTGRAVVHPYHNGATKLTDARGEIQLTANDELEHGSGVTAEDFAEGDTLRLVWEISAGSKTFIPRNGQLFVAYLGETP